jgi:hypothetical protein
VPPPGRDQRGRFVAGNQRGPGNPFARRVAGLRQVLLDTVTDDDLRAIAAKLIQMARDGDVAAARLLLAYTVRRPAAVVDPDTLDAQEVKHYAQTTTEMADLHAAVRGLPAALTCAVLRIVLPELEQARWGQIRRHFADVLKAQQKGGGREENGDLRSGAGERSGDRSPTADQRSGAGEQSAVRSPTAEARPAVARNGKPAGGGATGGEAVDTGNAEHGAPELDRAALEEEAERRWLELLARVTGHATLNPAEPAPAVGEREEGRANAAAAPPESGRPSTVNKRGQTERGRAGPRPSVKTSP